MAGAKKTMDARDAKASLQLERMGDAGFGKRRWLHDLWAHNVHQSYLLGLQGTLLYAMFQSKYDQSKESREQRNGS